VNSQPSNPYNPIDYLTAHQGKTQAFPFLSQAKHTNKHTNFYHKKPQATVLGFKRNLKICKTSAGESKEHWMDVVMTTTADPKGLALTTNGDVAYSANGVNVPLLSLFFKLTRGLEAENLDALLRDVLVLSQNKVEADAQVLDLFFVDGQHPQCEAR
jgi:hypothetical protein